MAAPILTTEQRSTMLSAIVMGFGFDEFARRYPDWPQDEMARYWADLATEVQSRDLDPGDFWGIPSEW